MDSTSMAFRPGWWLVFWGLLTSLSLNWVLPAFDHHAAEYNPFHSHDVVGDASPAQRQQLLAHHAHGAGQSHLHPGSPGTPVARDPHVVSLGALDGVLALVARAADVVAPPAWSLPPAPLALWLVAAAAVVLLSMLTVSPPERPPRIA
jgi:hypothetical protein